MIDEEYFAAAGIADNVAGEDEYVQALAQFNGIAHSKLQEWMEKHADTIDFLSSSYTDAITEVIQDTWDAFINNDFYGMKVFGKEVKGIDDVAEFLDRGYTHGFKDGEKAVGFNVPGGFSLVDKQAMGYIKDYNFELIQRIPDDIRLGIKGSVFKGMAIGESNELIKERIRNFITEPFPVYRRKDLALVEKGILKIGDIKPIRIIQPEFRSNMIARTEMMRAYNQGNKSAMLGTGQDTVLIPHVPNECRFCAMFAGQVYKLNSTDCPYLPFHPHCRHYYQPQVDVEKLKNDLRELQGFQDTTGVSPYDAAMDTLGNIPPGQKKLIDDTTNALPDHLRLNKFVDEGLIESVPGSGVEFVDSRYFKIGQDLKGEDLQREYLKNYAKNIFPRYKKDWDFEGFTPEQFYDIFSKYALDPMNVDARYYRDWMSEHVFRDGFSLKYAKELAEKEANDFWDWSGKPGLIENAMYDRYHYDYRILENKYSDLNRMINNYQYGGYYEVINKDLRAGRLPGTWEASDFSEEILFLDKVLDDNNIQGLPHAFTLYRGVENPGVFKGYKVGDVFQDPGFTSTSFEKDIMESFGDWKLTILAPSGTKGLYLEEFTLEGSPTWEWLLPRGTHFKIIQRDDATKSLLLKITDEPVTKLKAPEIPIFKKELPGAHGENAPIKFKAEDGNIWWAKQVGSATAAREMYGQTLAKEYGLKTYDEMLNKSVPFVDDKGLKKALKNNYAEGSNILYTKDIPDSLTFREALDLSSRDVMLEEFHDDAMKIFVYDVLTGNTDRHLGNIMVKNDGLYSIDYGYVGNRMQFLNHFEPDILKYKTTKTDFDSWFSKTFDKYLQEFDKINLEDLPKARAFQDEGSLTDVVKLNRENFREKILSEIERHDWFQFKVPDGVNIKTELTDDELADFVRWWDRLPDKRLKETISVERMYGDFPEFDNATGVLSYVAPDKWTTLTKGEKVFRDYLSTNIWTKYAAHVFESGDDFAKAYEKHLLGQAINDKEVRELFKNVDKATVKVDFPKGVVDTKEMRMSLGDIGDFNYRWKEDFSKVVPEWELVGSYENNLNEMGKYLYDIYKNPFDNAEQMGKALDEYIQHYIIADSDNIKYFNDLFAGKIEKIPKGPEITTDMDVDLSILNKLPKDLQQDIKIVNDVSDIDLITGYVEKGILHVPDIAETDRVLDNYLYHFVTLKYEPGPFRSADRMAQGLRTYLQRGKVTKSVGGLPRSKEFQDHIKNLVDGKLPKRTVIESQGWYEAQKWADDVFEYRSVDDEIVRAVENYKQHAYKYVNEELRVGEGLSFESEALIKNIDAGMQDSPVDMVVWRATSPKEHFELKKVGDMFDDKAYASTSLSKNTALGFEKRDGYLVELHIPKGIGVTNPEKMLFNAGYDVPYQEAEVLLDRGLQYKVLKLDHTNKTAIIEVVGKYEEPPKFPVAKEVLYTDPESLTSPVKFATKDGEEYWAKALKPYDAAFEDAGYKIGQKMGIEGYPSVEVVKWNDYPDGPLKKEIDTNWNTTFGKSRADRYSDIVITGNIDHAEEFDDFFDFTYQGTKKEWFVEHNEEVKQNILLNFLIGECDAHSRNVVFDADGIMHVIDHGMAGRKLDERFVDDILTKHWFKYNPVPKSQWDDVWKKEFSFWSKQFDDPKLLDGLDPQAAKFIKENQGNIKKRISEWMDKEQRWAPEPGPKIETDIKLDDNFHTMLNKLPEDLQQDIKIVYDKDIEWGDDYFKNGVLHISQDDSQLALNKYLELVVVQKFNPGPFNSSFSFKNNLYRYLKGEKVTPKKNQNYIKKMMDGKLQERPLLEQQTVVDAQRWADEAFPDYKKTITKDEIGGIQLYKGTFYGDTNNILRKEKAWKGDAENIIPAIDNIMEKNKSPMELIVWRGSSPKEKFELKKVGDVFTDKAFVSSSLDIGTARRFTGEKGYLATIKVPKGTPLVQTEKALQDINYNLMSGKEAEILMDRNLQFKILEKNDKARTVTLEVIGKEVGPATLDPKVEKEALKTEPMKEVREIKTKNIELSTEETNILQKMMGDLPEKYRPSSSYVFIRSFGKEPYEGRDGSGGVFGGMQLLIAEKTIDEDKLDNIIKAYGQAIRTQHKITSNELFDESFANYVLHQELLSKKVIKVYDNFFKSGKFNDNILKGIEKVELIKPQITPLNPKPKIKKVVEKVGNYKTINSSTGSDWISGIFSKQYDKVVSKDKKFAEHLETAKSHTDSLNVHFNKGGKVKDLDNVESLMQKTLDSAINNFKMPDNTIVYRGLKTKYVDPKLKTGDIFAPNCYSYTTLNKKWAEGFAGDEGYTVRYLLPKGTNAFSFDLIYTLGGMEVPYRLEQEFLLAREQAFKVLNVNHNTKEMTVVAVNVKKT